MCRAFRKDNFQRGPDVSFAEMTRPGSAVAGAKDDMDVQCGLALRIVDDVTDQRGHLNLLADGNF